VPERGSGRASTAGADVGGGGGGGGGGGDGGDVRGNVSGGGGDGGDGNGTGGAENDAHQVKMNDLPSPSRSICYIDDHLVTLS